jgi:Fic family protein
LWAVEHCHLRGGVPGDTPFRDGNGRLSRVLTTLLSIQTGYAYVPYSSLAEQVRRLEKKVERERIVLAALPDLSLQIVEFAREHGRVTIGDAIKLTGVSRNTLKLHFRNLVERGHLNQHGSGRGVWYELK